MYASARRLKNLDSLADLGISTLALDVGSEASVKEAVATVLSREERLDVLVNNAGISKFGPLAEQPLADVAAIFDTNVMGVLRMTQVGLMGQGPPGEAWGGEVPHEDYFCCALLSLAMPLLAEPQALTPC